MKKKKKENTIFFFPLLFLLLLPSSTPTTTTTATASTGTRGLPRPQPVQLRVSIFQRMTSKGLPVRRQVCPPQVLQQLPPPREHRLQAPRRALVLPVGREVLGERVDALREGRDLGLGGTRVVGVAGRGGGRGPRLELPRCSSREEEEGREVRRRVVAFAITFALAFDDDAEDPVDELWLWRRGLGGVCVFFLLLVLQKAERGCEK